MTMILNEENSVIVKEEIHIYRREAHNQRLLEEIDEQIQHLSMALYYLDNSLSLFDYDGKRYGCSVARIQEKVIQMKKDLEELEFAKIAFEQSSMVVQTVDWNESEEREYKSEETEENEE